MRLIERDRRQATQDREDDLLARLGRAERQVRTLLKRVQDAWDQGFACAIDMAARGATLDELRERVRQPQEVPVLARGTRDFGPRATDDIDTVPIALPVIGER